MNTRQTGEKIWFPYQTFFLFTNLSWLDGNIIVVESILIN